MERIIKMDEVLKHLSHKERHVSDLAAFLKNKCEKTPNYTLLLGAGCSVTSGVSTGVDLIKQWKNEIYSSENYENLSEEDFWKEQFQWYDSRNPYSSLFQKKYDLPRQRRIFVENEVAGKNPAIGYAYLIKLIENNYFNTIFTTNFDDLINEAFYRFSSQRPIVCAHDSSISSITVTSKRPKIIKLHGDYLFDDIKSTLRETESLNDNMKAKFIEFAKDHGLIVIGYAGNDRSVMDILSMLLQKEDYYKHGIYWCIREGDDNISDELRQLLWKDRVYYVRISGFDELMAELNLLLNDGRLPIENELLSSKKQKKMIEDLTDNRYFSEKTKANSIIKNDMTRLSQTLSKNIINDFFDIMNKKNRSIKAPAEPKRRDSLKELSENERQILDEINNLLTENNYDDAKVIINQNLENVGDQKTRFVFYLYDFLSVVYSSISGSNNDLKIVLDKMIELIPHSEDNYIRAFRLINNHEQKISYLNKAIELFPEDIYLFNEKADYLLDFCDGYVEENLNEFLREIKSAIDRSLTINDTPYNRAWLLECEYNKRANVNDIERQKSEIKLLVDKFSTIKTKNLAKAYQLYYKSLGFSEQKCEEELTNMFLYSKKTDDLRFVETCAIELLKYYMHHNKEKEFCNITENYKKEYIPSEDFNIIMAHAYLRYFSDFRKGEEIIRNGGESIMWKELFFEYLCNTRQHNRAIEVRQKYFMNDPLKTIKFYSTFDDNKVIEYLEDYWKTNPHTLSDISTYACACINHELYEKAYLLCKNIAVH